MKIPDRGYSEGGKRWVAQLSKLRIAKEDEIPELLSGVSHYLKQRMDEIARGFEVIQTWEPFLLGYRSGFLTGLNVASEIVQVMADRATASGNPWLIEPYPLDGLTSISN
jgi:cell division protein ZapA (FtsZ GTPase activity inhibitor)